MKLKRLCALICCMAVMCTTIACSDNKVKDEEYNVDDSNTEDVIEAAKDDVVQYLTDGALKSSDTVMTVNGEDVSASYLLYWAASNISDYGYSDASAMDEDNGDGSTIGEEILNEAKDTAAYYLAIRQQAEERELALDEDQQTEVTNYMDSLDENSLLYYSTNEDDQKNIYETYLYSMELQNTLYGDEGEYTVTDDDLKTYMSDNEYLTADYMFFGNSGDSEQAAEEALQRAQEVYDTIKNVDEDEFENVFAEEQENADVSETDHTFYVGGGEDEKFASGVADLEIGETALIQSDSGVYIAHRKELNTDSIKEECAYNLFYEQLDSWSEDAKVDTNSNFDKIDITQFCEKLLTLQNAITETENAEAENAEDTTNISNE